MLKRAFRTGLISLMFFGFTSISAAPKEDVIALDSQPTCCVGKIFEGGEINAIQAYVEAHTLVVFDVDYTIFRSKTPLGSTEWFFHLVNRQQAKGDTKVNSFQKYYPVWMKAQKYNELQLMDPKIPSLINKLHKKAFGVIALTSRQPVAAELTRWQLSQFGIDFNRSKGVSDLTYTPAFPHPTLFRKGIIFSNDLNKKGEVFYQWLSEILPQLKNKKIKRIVFIDDIEKNIISVGTAAKKLGFEYVGLRYNKADDFKAKFRPAQVEKELKILTTNCSDSETRLLLEQAGAYQE